jgi:xanthine/CO dehydrogenase XdhC/CoxF family maturation factor
MSVSGPGRDLSPTYKSAASVAIMGDQVLVVVGDGPVSEKLAPMAGLLGWSTTLAVTLPEALAAVPTADAVVVTSHHAEVDGPAIAAALAVRPSYIGAMGSRRTQTRRREWLLANGHTEADLGPLHGPAGLDIGADSPGEIALAILAELVATVRGATRVGSISDRDGPIHPDLAPGEAFCPSG